MAARQRREWQSGTGAAVRQRKVMTAGC
jgi:hypothetical protein